MPSSASLGTTKRFPTKRLMRGASLGATTPSCFVATKSIVDKEGTTCQKSSPGHPVKRDYEMGFALILVTSRWVKPAVQPWRIMKCKPWLFGG